MVIAILTSRSSIYASPDLTDWSGNGGDKINKKIQQLLNNLGTNIPGAEQVVKEEVAKLSKKKGSPAKEKNGSTTPSPKKRKRVVKEEDEAGLDDW
jgi:hypothetical protein